MIQLPLSPSCTFGDLTTWDAKGLPGVSVPGLYVHIPFCFHKCHYCDFYSITRQSPERMTLFVDLLLREADFWRNRGPTLRPRTIFFGGGTPSLLPLDQMRRLLSGLRDRLDLSALNEWTVECNPATVSAEYCCMLREMGINRLSFGAQSFDKLELATLERHHDPADVAKSIRLARQAGFKRLNVDLIYAIPHQDLTSWEHSLETALSLQTDHISCYALTYEPNTPMAVKKRLGSIVPIEDSLELEMLHWTRQRLAEGGFHAYEISNYALPNQECRHNLLYWNGGSYIGLGPSAASHIEGWRWKNRPHLGEWEHAVSSGQIPAAQAEHLTPRQRAGELAMLQLRLETGVNWAALELLAGPEIRSHFSPIVARMAGLGLVKPGAFGFQLTPKGLNVADAIAAEFL